MIYVTTNRGVRRLRKALCNDPKIRKRGVGQLSKMEYKCSDNELTYNVLDRSVPIE
jgi:hypothetical protein